MTIDLRLQLLDGMKMMMAPLLTLLLIQRNRMMGDHHRGEGRKSHPRDSSLLELKIVEPVSDFTWNDAERFESLMMW